MRVRGRLRLGHDRPQQRPRPRHVFQIAPATGRGSLWLAYQAHLANEAWNASVPCVEPAPQPRAGLPRCRRSPHGAGDARALARYLTLSGEVRTACGPAEHAVQHRRPDLLRRGRAGGAVHGELRHQPHRLPRHARHDGEHRPGLRCGAGGHRHRDRRPGGKRTALIDTTGSGKPPHTMQLQ